MAKAFVRIIDGTAYLTVMDGDRVHSTDSVHVRLWSELVREGACLVWVHRKAAEEDENVSI